MNYTALPGADRDVLRQAVLHPLAEFLAGKRDPLIDALANAGDLEAPG